MFTNQCPVCGPAGPLIKAEYEDKQLHPLAISSFWKFLPWLPCTEWNENFKTSTIVYKSSGLAKELGLNNLYIAFNGYWPEKNAEMVTCTFKELEAPPTFQRTKEKCIDSMVLASAGNTAKAFINAARFYDIQLYVVVPYTCRKRLILPFEKPENVTIIAPNENSDYSDSISFARRMTLELGIINEDGARNVARRDGMGTVMLEAVMNLKR
ncbi:MAG: pyridoxal-phosphate dependent enzyme, partial [Thermoplasmata archaeon]|nr:pyridoxal-phosphate dependent enzyme [Thermoplasmata archaeon]